MRIHRFYVPDIELTHNFWLHDQRLISQWRKVLRMSAGQEVLLFDGLRSDRLYKITELSDREAHLEFVTDYDRKLPKYSVYLAWSLLKKDKNEWVLQKATELGVSHFMPVIADRSEKLGFDEDRAHKIVIEASEQCGRSDIPTVREPMHIATVIAELQDKADLYICEQATDAILQKTTDRPMVIFIGPEGGWSDEERTLFKDKGLKHLALNDLTLRAETAAVVASAQLLQ